ncbi:S8 family serine peptidase [Streptomyces sp. NPDC004609]|uniref:S8 family serine peptidase n=1 Tax=Streptomyces sp. NPDC004609 TaxID=3364704 RepID=UPI003677FF7F
MRPMTRTALGAATAAVLAAGVIAPSAASPHDGDGTTGERPLVGSEPAARKGERPVTVTLVTGDRVLVRRDPAGAPTATLLPRADGTTPLVQTRRSGRDLYVYPDGAASALAAGTVDEELFNVTGLIRQGYDDERSPTLPLIAVYGTDVSRSAPATPRGARRGPVLKAVDGLALRADKKRAATFWADLARTRGSSRMTKLWLDRKVEATLDRSTRQVRADAAWAAGYDGKGTKVAVLDTGADAGHPDLKGRITASRNFTDSATDGDVQGHGTHTMSTVGGSGAASGGRNKGVAPGADLLNGKVLDDWGSGATSWIIAGMQWAVDNEADVVSMSLGSSEPTDCTDPMSTATAELARTQGTLFVVAAGNSGPALNTVSSPGCVPAVLTVGAVGRDDSTAGFSSRGPARVTHTLKPEIAAPGVDISAAAAGGRGVYAYQTMSGTSMATPHVAGAAAVLRQRHPDWTAQRLKAALVSSAEPSDRASAPGDVRETGAGRLDVRAAVSTTVTGAPAVQGGTFTWPQHGSDRTTVRIPYTNTGDRPVRLDLAVRSVTGNDGSRVRATLARLGTRSVTVPAGATVTVPLTLDPSVRLDRAQYGDITGRVIATASGVSVSTPFALYVQPETVTLRVKLVDRAGAPAAGFSSLDVIGTDDATGERRFNNGAAEQVYRLRPGSYFLSSFTTSPDLTIGYLARPQFELTKDTTVVLDAREAHRLSVRTDRPGEAHGATLGFSRTWDEWLHDGSVTGNRLVTGYYADVRGRARDGDFEFASYWRTYAPLIDELSVVGGGDLRPIAASSGSVNLDGTGRADVVDAGRGTPEELRAAGVAGKFALVAFPDGGGSAYTLARDAKAAGAKAVIVHRPSAGRWLPSTGHGAAPHPVLVIEAAEAASLRERLSAGPVTLRWRATARSPYVYNLAFPEDGPVTSGRVYRVRDGGLGRNESTYHAMGVRSDYTDSVLAYRPDGAQALISGLNLVGVPGTRTEFHSTGDTSWDHLVSSSFPWGEYMVDPPRAYRPGQRRAESWYGGVPAPATPRDSTGEPELAAERQGRLIGAAPAFWGDSEHSGLAGSFGDLGSLKLTRDGEEVGESPYPFGVFEVPAGEAAYELTLSTTKIGLPSTVWKRSTRVETAWRFRSALDESVYSQGIPLLFPGYRLPEDGLKTLPAADGQRITLTATGHAGYRPAALTSAKLSYSYDGGDTWTVAPTSRKGGQWTATVDHAGAAGRPVTLRTELTDANGNSVTQTVADAYAVR